MIQVIIIILAPPICCKMVPPNKKIPATIERFLIYFFFLVLENLYKKMEKELECLNPVNRDPNFPLLFFGIGRQNPK